MKVSGFAAVAGLAMVAFTGSAMAGPNIQSKGVKFASAMPVKRDPLTVRGARLVDGKIVGTTAWRPYVGGNKDAAPSAYAFDAFENGLGVPTDGVGPNGNRYLFLWTAGSGIFDYLSPLRISDMTMAPGFEGVQSQWADIIVLAGDQSNPNKNADFFVGLFTAEDKLTAGCAFDGSTAYDGVQLGFGPGDAFFFSNVDLSTDPTLFWQLPNDGVGSYITVLSQDQAGTVIADGQTGMWCTGEDTLPTPEVRAGTNEGQEVTEDSTPPTIATNKLTNIPDGIFQVTNGECSNLTFNIPNVASVLTTGFAFGAEPGTACYADCDGDTILTIDDFICFQTFFALGDPYADCDGDTILTIDDFICFQTFFAIGCG